MKRLVFTALLLMTALGAFAQGRYGIKSGIAKTRTVTDGHETFATQYFDDYGKKESLKQRMDIPGLVSYDYYTITKGNKAWMITVTDGKRNVRDFDNPTPDLTFLNPSQEVMAKYNMQYLGDEKVLGKPCKKYSYEIKQNRKTVLWTVWAYKGFPLKTVTQKGKKTNTIEVTELKENVAVPQDVFKTTE
ncbi:MAG: hypothetical protein IJU21_06225 [Bacteroidales bacterium]|nr:hypothetical protein [Bacteroidales bacterium]